MTKETLITYLDKQLTKKITEYDTAIDWDAKNHTIELVIRLFAENAATTSLMMQKVSNQKRKSLNLKMVFYFTIRKNHVLMKKII